MFRALARLHSLKLFYLISNHILVPELEMQFGQINLTPCFHNCSGTHG